MSFESPTAKLTIGSLDEPDDPDYTVAAQYNPKDLQIDKSVPWQKHAKNNANGLQLEFTGADGRSMSIEMFFDGYEGAVDVQDQVEILESLATVRDVDSTDDTMRRPHHCVVTWGSGGIPDFQCVIESLSTKYTMFASDGTPVRATVTLKLKEADRLSMAAAGS